MVLARSPPAVVIIAQVQPLATAVQSVAVGLLPFVIRAAVGRRTALALQKTLNATILTDAIFVMPHAAPQDEV